MVDFKKLRESRSQPPAIDPLEIFRRLPKPPEIRDLYVSQAEALQAWFQRRNEKDLLIKLHTGGGKTLVGLLMAQSVINETGRPVVYVTPNKQLTEQALAKAKEYSIPAVPIPPSEKGRRVEFPDEVLSGRAAMVCNYDHLFNGKSRFGVRGGDREIFSAAALILDDAHVAFPSIRDSYTLSIERKENEEAYKTITNAFRPDFAALDRVGTFDDIVAGVESTVVEVPYWAWRQRLEQVRELIRQLGADDFVWPLIRDNLAYCHVIISRTAFTVTPYLPFVDLIPTFVDCPRRIYMSATIADDSSMIRTFDSDPKCVDKPIVSKSFAGIGERMILVPELMKNAIEFNEVVASIKTLLKGAAAQYGGAVVLVPSFEAAKKWTDVGPCPQTAKEMSDAVVSLQRRTANGPFVFASRYDGVDLPGDACRVLVLSHLPRGTSDYELCIASSLMNASSLRGAIAQRIEQGLGRAARGPTDYCVAVIIGRSLVNWLSRRENERLLTGVTRAQLRIGLEVSETVTSTAEFLETAEKCLERDPDWKTHHAESLALLTVDEEPAARELHQATLERKALRLFRDGYHEKAIHLIRDYLAKNQETDRSFAGWLLQLGARIAEFWDHGELAQELQRAAFANNKNLFRPRVAPPYVPLNIPGEQATRVVDRVLAFAHSRGVLAEFDEIATHFTPFASSNQFEQALHDLGEILGFAAERPEKAYGAGPDVLWLLTPKLGLVLEAKSRKETTNPLAKEEYGQLLTSVEWFKHHYPEAKCIGAAVAPTDLLSERTVANDTKVMTLALLHELVVASRTVLEILCRSSLERPGMIQRAETLLSKESLKAEALAQKFLRPLRMA